MPNMREVNERIISQFRSGAPMRMPREKMLLLTTTGRRSGIRRTVPMMCARIDGALIVVASNSGALRDPDWYRNLVANPEVAVEIGETSISARAETVTGDRRAGVWAALIKQIPMYAEHQASTDRQIPLVELILDQPGVAPA